MLLFCQQVVSHFKAQIVAYISADKTIMKELAAIIHSFTAKEADMYKRLYGSGNVKEPNKPEMLFDLIYSKTATNDREVIKALYADAKAPASAFSHLKNKLREQLTTILIASDAEKSEDDEVDYNYMLRKVSKQFLEARVFVNRGNAAMALEVLKKAYKTAKEYEVLAFLPNITMTLYGQQYSRETKYLNELKTTQAWALDAHAKYVEGENLLWSLAAPNILFKNREQEFLENAKEIRKKLRGFYESTRSDNIHFQYLEAELFVAEMERKTNEAVKIAEDRFQLVNSSRALKRASTIRNTRNQLLNAYLNALKFDKAYQLAYSNIADVSFAHALTFGDLGFRAAFYSGNLNHCEAFLDLYKKHPKFIKDETATAKYWYFMAVLAFGKKEYKSVFGHLTKANALLKDKTGWGLGIKLLEILTYIEMGEIDLVMFRIKAVWQLLFRNPQKNVARIKAISSMLYALLQSGFNYRKVTEREKKKMKELRDAQGVFYWDPTGFEITRFDWWIDEKMKRIR